MQVSLWAIQPGSVDKAELVERAARVCYRSKMSSTPEKRAKFLKSLEKNGHLTVFEHAFYVQRVPSFDSLYEDLWPQRYGSNITTHGEFPIVSYNARNVIEATEINPVLKGVFTPYEIEILDDLSSEEQLTHASATFEISGISRACSHQLVRHRKGSYSQESQRYVDMSKSGFVVPLSIKQNYEAREIFESLASSIAWYYRELLSLGIPKEDARFVLPNAAATRIVVTMVFADLVHFFKLRLAPDAQWEIREVAKEMLRQVHAESPTVFGDVHRKYLEIAIEERKS